jgi:hypothetical protein
MIPSWPEDGPGTVEALLAAAEDDPASLTESQRAVVSWIHEGKRVSGQIALSSPQAVRKLLTFPDGKAKNRGTMVVPAGKWLSVPLTESRHRVLDSHRGGGHHWRQYISAAAPTADELSQLPTRWGWLLLFGGGPSVLADDQVRASLAQVTAKHRVLDVLLWDAALAGSPTMHSLKARVGGKAALGRWSSVPFPDPAVLDRALKEVILT